MSEQQGSSSGAFYQLMSEHRVTTGPDAHMLLTLASNCQVLTHAQDVGIGMVVKQYVRYRCGLCLYSPYTFRL